MSLNPAKLAFSISLSCIFSNISLAQDVTPELPSSYIINPKVNYVRTWDVNAPFINPNALTTSGVSEVKQSTVYLDGLGRPIQTVTKAGSIKTGSSNVDLVNPVIYDASDREVRKYLPYASSSADGLFKSDPFNQQKTFYESTNSPIYGQGETFFYSKIEFEASPLSRTERTYAAGNNWVNAGKGIKVRYWTNTTVDDVRIWTVDNTANVGSFDSYTTSASYQAGELFKLISEDEQGKQVIEFKDRQGKVILKKAQFTATAETDGNGSNHLGWLCTYYIYDDLGQLRCVIQPEGVKTLETNGWNLSSNNILLNEQCFRYEYDEQGRMIVKKVPGAGEVYMVYDVRDRIVMTQDANMRVGSPKWMITFYDGLNRPIKSGLLNNDFDGSNKSFEQHRTAANTSSNYPFTIDPTTGWELLTETHYDDYNNLPPGLSSLLNNSYNTYGGFFTNYNVNPEYAQEVKKSEIVKGLVTWTKVKVLGTTNQYITSVNIYDEKGQTIQVQSINQNGDLDVLTTQYSFNGNVLRTHLIHQKSGTGNNTYQILTKNEYDALWRLTAVKKIVNNNSTNITKDKTILRLGYDALGQLITKKLDGKDLSTEQDENGALYYVPSEPAIETLTYDYNIRGWMLGVNRGFSKDKQNLNNKFGFDLAYDKTSIKSGSTEIGAYTLGSYNGNIRGMLWKSIGDNEIRKYEFSYDAVNRLSKGDFTEYGGSSNWGVSKGIDYSMGGDPATGGLMKYDYNGNIKEMWHKGFKITGSDYIDKLSYHYYDNTNKLKNVIDDKNDAQTTLGDFRYSPQYMSILNGTKTLSTQDYLYDDNGNLIKDWNKDIIAIHYNHLNLPVYINTNKGDIFYMYDAAGNKLRKRTVENASSNNGNVQTTTTTKYISGFVYESKTKEQAGVTTVLYEDKLLFFSHEEGRIRYTENIYKPFVYDYFVKDHLGNVRMVLTNEEQINYYPASTLEGNTVSTDKSMINWEKQFFKIDDTKVVLRSSISSWTSSLDYQNNNGNPPYNSVASGSYPSDHTVNDVATSEKVYQLNGTTNKIGLGMTIKVMAGDKINILGKSYYHAPSQTFDDNNSSTLILTELLNAFLGSPGNAALNKGISQTDLSTLNSNSYSIPTDFFRGDDNSSSTIPKAYINYIFFDEQFRYAGGDASKVSASGSVYSHWFNDTKLQNISVPKNGYLYVYVSNESNVNVYFDNLQIIHNRGPILEETHYYPFGLTMAGISSKAAGGIENKNKYNDGTELNTDLDVSLYETKFRFYDPQIGRFHQIDKLSFLSRDLSSYVYGSNNPILRNDPSGLKDSVIHHKDGTIEHVNTDKNLENVTVVSINGGLWAKTRFYYRMMDYTNGDLSRIQNNALRELMYRMDGIVRLREKVHQMAHDQDLFVYGTLLAPVVFVEAGFVITELELIALLKESPHLTHFFASSKYNKAIRAILKYAAERMPVSNIKEFERLGKILAAMDKYRDIKKDYKVLKEIEKVLNEIGKLKY